MRITSIPTTVLLGVLTLAVAACGPGSAAARNGSARAAGRPAGAASSIATSPSSGPGRGGFAQGATSTITPSAQPAPRCAGTPEPAGTQLTILNADNGRFYCVTAGENVVVYLTGSAADKWTQITPSSANLVPVPDGTMMLRLGVTGAAFRAIGPGTATLTSTRSACKTCMEVLFRVTLVISPAA